MYKYVYYDAKNKIWHEDIKKAKKILSIRKVVATIQEDALTDYDVIGSQIWGFWIRKKQQPPIKL